MKSDQSVDKTLLFSSGAMYFAIGSLRSSPNGDVDQNISNKTDNENAATASAAPRRAANIE